MSNPPNLNSPPGAPPVSSTPSAPTTAAETEAQRNRRLVYYASLSVVVAAPAIALMPPRKLDLYTFGLGVAWCMSAGQVSEQRTGRGLLWHIGSRIPSAANRERRERAEEAEAREVGREGERERKRARRFGVVDGDGDGKGERKESGFWRKVWMGGEGEDWIERRRRREEEVLGEGRGYGGLIADQIREVWGVKRGDEDEDEDERAGESVDDGKER